MRRIIICDDEEVIRSQLAEYLKKSEPILKEQFDIIFCCSAEELLDNARDCDIILLDIQMKELSGMDAAHILRERNNTACIIFITSLVNYAVEGYQVHAFGFLTKPVNYGSFLQQMQDALLNVNSKRGKEIYLKRGAETHRYNSNKIYYIEVRSHNLRVSFKDSDEDYYANLNDVEEMLAGQNFFRCHKGYLVNLRHVSKVLQNDIFLDNGRLIPISRHRKKDFMTEYMNYLGRRQII